MWAAWSGEDSWDACCFTTMKESQQEFQEKYRWPSIWLQHSGGTPGSPGATRAEHSLEDKLTMMCWEKGGGCWGIHLPHKARHTSTRSKGEKGKAGKGEERCQEDGEPAWASRISNDKLTAKLGLCQHVLPKSDRNDGLAHLPFISGKFSLHPAYYELAGICLIVFASATQLAEIKALLLLQSQRCTLLQGRSRVLCTWLLRDSGEGGHEGWHSATQSKSSQAPRNPKP